MLRRDLRHELVARDGVVILPRALGVDLCAGEPGVGADVGLAEAVGMDTAR